MNKVSTLLLSIVLFVLLTSVFYTNNVSTPILKVDKTQKELLGKLIFNDANYSSPNGVSCATCHSPNTAFSDPRNAEFSQGVLGRLGNRNAPAIMYMLFTPQYAFNNEEDMHVG
jgi:cytochrome c peroxidase